MKHEIESLAIAWDYSQQTTNTKDKAWYVFDKDRIATFTKAEADAIAQNYPKAQVIPSTQAGTL